MVKWSSGNIRVPLERVVSQVLLVLELSVMLECHSALLIKEHRCTLQKLDTQLC